MHFHAESSPPRGYVSIAVANTKGGTGKTSLAISLGWEYHLRGYRTLMVDTDMQGSLMDAAALVSESGEPDHPTSMSMGGNIGTDLDHIAHAYDVVIIDTPGYHSDVVKHAMVTAARAPGGGLTIVPMGTSVDVFALERGIIPTISDVRFITPDLDVRFLSYGFATGSTLAGDVRALAVECYPELPFLGASVAGRVDMARAVAHGVGVTKYASGGISALEVTRTADEIADIVGLRSIEEVAS